MPPRVRVAGTRDLTPQSDLDLLIVLDEIPDFFAELDRITDLYAARSVACGISISPVLLAESA